MASLSGKLENEVELHVPAAKFFEVFTTQLHEIQNISDSVHDTKLHQGDDWHAVDSQSVKNWTIVLDGNVATCKEHLEEIDHANKSLTFNVFDGDVATKYKTLKAKLKVIDKDGSEGGGIAKWIYEYEKLHEGIPPPQDHLDFATNVTKDIDAHLSKTTT